MSKKIIKEEDLEDFIDEILHYIHVDEELHCDIELGKEFFEKRGYKIEKKQLSPFERYRSQKINETRFKKLRELGYSIDEMLKIKSGKEADKIIKAGEEGG